jgi:hypothetical protein
VAVALLA